jgi:hypothetical protein
MENKSSPINDEHNEYYAANVQGLSLGSKNRKKFEENPKS